MTDRIILSGPESYPVTWIDGKWLCTVNPEVKMGWHSVSLVPVEFVAPQSGKWQEYPHYHNLVYYDPWRIRLADARPVYEYKEGEPWAQVIEDPDEGGLVSYIECGAEAVDEGLLDYGWVFCLHRRAALVCDTPEQFRAFAEWLGQ